MSASEIIKKLVKEINPFGDNYNDIEMFEMADEGCAVANAVEKIKELSTQVIGHHNEDGVAKFIESKWQK